MKWLPLGTGEFRQLFRLTDDSHSFIRYFLAECGETNHPPCPFDKSDAEQRLELSKTRRQCRLGDEAGVCSSAEMPV